MVQFCFGTPIPHGKNAPEMAKTPKWLFFRFVFFRHIGGTYIEDQSFTINHIVADVLSETMRRVKIMLSIWGVPIN